jgi:hypothetical protein
MFSSENKKSRTDESELKKMEKVVVDGLKVKGKAHALSSTQWRKVSKELKKTCGVDMILYSHAPTLKAINRTSQD